MKYPFSFTVVATACGPSNYCAMSGLGIADSFSDAARQIEEHFGSELFSIKNLELFEESELIFLPNTTINKYIDSENYVEPIPCDVHGNPI